MTKKILLFLLTALPLSLLHAQTYTYEANNKKWSYTVSGGNATITGARNLNNSAATGELNIPDKVGTAPQYTVTEIADNAFGSNEDITSLTIPASVTTIGFRAFYYCRNMTGNLELPNVTSIGQQAFLQCRGLTGTLKLPKITTISIQAFNGCFGLTGLELPNVTNIDYQAFNNCSSLTGKLELPKVTTIGNYAFFLCRNLTSLELPKVTTIGDYAFYGCSNLTGNLELPNVTTIGNQAFQNCSGLIKLELPNVTIIGNYAFYSCSNLTSLELPKVTTIGDNAFYGGSNLTGKLELPNVTTIGDGAFYYCSNLTGLEFPKVTTIGKQAFFLCTGLIGKLELPKTLTSIDEMAFSDCINLSAVKFENGTHLTNITGNSHFKYGQSLQYIDMTGVTFPSTFTTVSRNINSSLFGETQPYTMVYLPNNPALSASSNERNFVIGNTCDNFVVYENHFAYKNLRVGCDYPIQYTFTATKAEYLNRGFSGASCKTICLPYKAMLPIGLRAYKLVTKTRGGAAFRFKSVGDGNGTVQLEANTPYLIRIINGSSYITTPVRDKFLFRTALTVCCFLRVREMHQACCRRSNTRPTPHISSL